MSIIPTEIAEKSENAEQADYYFDEFGFRVEKEDKPEPDSSKLLAVPFTEDESSRLKWIAHLEFSTNSNGDLNFETNTIPKTEKLRNMVIFEGIPHSLRPSIWMCMSGAYEKRKKSQSTYAEIVKASNIDTLMTSKQIEKDLIRILPSNYCFTSMNSLGIPRLRRILRGLAWMFPDIGYCQGTGVIVASLLLILEEEECFWLTATIVEDLLPASYYSSTLLGIQADQKVLQSLITNYLPSIDETLKQHDIDISLITFQWFLTLFASVVHMKILLRLWDFFFCDGSIVLFQLTLGMIKLKESSLNKLENSAQIFNALSDIPGEIEDIDALLKVSLDVGGSLNQMMIDTHRRRHLAYLMVDQGVLVGNLDVNPMPNLPKQHLAKREVKKSKSMIQMLLFGNDEEEDELKTRNIKNSEIIVELRDAILKIARHFVNIEPKLNGKINLQADYSANSHVKDHENYINVSRNRQRRAKALHDFERHDPDELGFRKNDIITIVSQKDEDCWIGELNGLQGWFPAKFVELLDERSKVYVPAGDDSLCETITDLVRGTCKLNILTMTHRN
jgi:small G protein signaling modulator 3